MCLSLNSAEESHGDEVSNEWGAALLQVGKKEKKVSGGVLKQIFRNNSLDFRDWKGLRSKPNSAWTFAVWWW